MEFGRSRVRAVVIARVGVGGTRGQEGTARKHTCQAVVATLWACKHASSVLTNFGWVQHPTPTWSP